MPPFNVFLYCIEFQGREVGFEVVVRDSDQVDVLLSVEVIQVVVPEHPLDPLEDAIEDLRVRLQLPLLLRLHNNLKLLLYLFVFFLGEETLDFLLW